MLPQKIVVFGGSSIAGVGDPVGGGFIDRLKRWHQLQNPTNILFNLGVNGDTTNELISRLLPEAALRKPGLIIISVGSNDVYRKDSINAPKQTTLENYKSNIHKLIEQSLSLCPVVFLSAFPINESKTTPMKGWGHTTFYLKKDQEEYQEAAKQICLDLNIPYCDVYSEWLKHDYTTWLTEDGLHANPAGHEKVFIFLKNFLKNLHF
jgi:lysophospholipase L1-like esterase